MSIVCPGPAIRAEDIALGGEQPEGGAPQRRLTLEELERAYIREVLEETGWVIKGPRGAATRLGMARSTLYDRMNKLGIERP